MTKKLKYTKMDNGNGTACYSLALIPANYTPDMPMVSFLHPEGETHTAVNDGDMCRITVDRPAQGTDMRQRAREFLDLVHKHNAGVMIAADDLEMGQNFAKVVMHNMPGYRSVSFEAFMNARAKDAKSVGGRVAVIEQNIGPEFGLEMAAHQASGNGWRIAA